MGVALLAVMASGLLPSGGGAADGVVVERVDANGAAERAGVVVGDSLLAWWRAACEPANPEPAGIGARLKPGFRVCRAPFGGPGG